VSARKPLSLAARGEVARKYQLNDEILARVWMERLRQKHLLSIGKIKFDLASPVVSNDRKLRVTTEENGEVARAIDLLENAETPAAILKAKRHLQEELNQLTACSIAWLEALEEELKS
jgi:hypothetical protein